jgi:hypothetical protein
VHILEAQWLVAMLGKKEDGSCGEVSRAPPPSPTAREEIRTRNLDGVRVVEHAHAPFWRVRSLSFSPVAVVVAGGGSE